MFLEHFPLGTLSTQREKTKKPPFTIYYSKQFNDLRKEKKQQLSQTTLTVRGKSSFSRHQMRNKGDRVKETKKHLVISCQVSIKKAVQFAEVISQVEQLLQDVSITYLVEELHFS